MKRILIRVFLAGAAVALLSGVGLSQIRTTCPRGVCQPVALPAANPVSAAVLKIEWRTRDDQPQVRFAYVDGLQVGAYDRDSGDWRDFDPIAQSWGASRQLFELRLIPAVNVPLTEPE